MELNGKTAIITGGGRGIGRAIALDLIREGCRIAICSRNHQEISAVCQEARAMSGDVLGLPMDLSIDENLQILVEKTVSQFGTVDILVNNAGLVIQKSFLDVGQTDYEQTLCLNLKAVFFLSQKVLTIMAGNRSGYIINISSAVTQGVPQELATYGISKYGLVGLSQALYDAAREYGVRVSTIYPDTTDTRMVRSTAKVITPEKWMQPEDISQCVLFLLKSSERMIIKEMVPLSTGFGNR
jgi:3-oxoacyl-[acyl-carrier protein] reductase